MELTHRSLETLLQTEHARRQAFEHDIQEWRSSILGGDSSGDHFVDWTLANFHKDLGMVLDKVAVLRGDLSAREGQSVLVIEWYNVSGCKDFGLILYAGTIAQGGLGVSTRPVDDRSVAKDIQIVTDQTRRFYGEHRETTIIDYRTRPHALQYAAVMSGPIPPEMPVFDPKTLIGFQKSTMGYCSSPNISAQYHLGCRPNDTPEFFRKSRISDVEIVVEEHIPKRLAQLDTQYCG